MRLVREVFEAEQGSVVSEELPITEAEITQNQTQIFSFLSTDSDLFSLIPAVVNVTRRWKLEDTHIL